MRRVHPSADLRRVVIERAKGKCEYCLVHQDDTPFTHPIDHIIAIRHGGQTVADNLALACLECNRNKGADLTTIDPLTGAITPLFHPRKQAWHEHFHLEGEQIVGLTAIGRATVILLRLNDPMRLMEREALMTIERYQL